MLKKIQFISYQNGNLFSEPKDFYYLKKKENKKLNENNLKNDLSLMKEFIYLSSSSNNILMEKRLGKDEHIIISSSCLLLFEDTIHFNNLEGNKKYVSQDFF